jgi:MoaA/NifB/PqqE/SkfB family radical SAM enzyme
MYKYSDIKTVHLEITQACQAACPMCDRNENGGAPNKHMTGAELSLADCKKIFLPEFIAQLSTMYMCGNLGDPIVAADTLDVFRYFREHNPAMWLSMNTNAGARDSAWWAELASVFGTNGSVIFSVDGLRDTNHLYRQNVNWDKVENSMHSFIAAGGRARWDYIIFEHNQHQVDKAEALSKEWGFEKFTKKKTGRFFSTNTHTGKDEHKAHNKAGTVTWVLKKPEAKFLNAATEKETMLIGKYGSMEKYYDNCSIDCKVIKDKSIFITAEGLLQPCCWTAGRMYKWWREDPATEQIWGHINTAGGKQGINVINNSLEDTINSNALLDSIESSWAKQSISDGKLLVCANKCGAEFDAFQEQFK